MTDIATRYDVEQRQSESYQSSSAEILHPVALNLLAECLDKYTGDTDGASEFLRNKVASLYDAIDKEAWRIGETDQVLNARKSMSNISRTLIRTTEHILTTGSTAMGIQRSLEDEYAEAHPYNENDWQEYEKQHQMFSTSVDKIDEHKEVEETVSNNSSTDLVLIPEVLPLMEHSEVDENGYTVPDWGSRLPVNVDSLDWADQDLKPNDIEIRFNDQQIPAVPLGNLARYHGARRTHAISDPRGRKEVFKLILQIPQALANLVGSRAVFAGLALQDHGLSKIEVNEDLADRVNTQWVAGGEARLGTRPDQGLRSYSKIRNTFYKPVGGEHHKPKQLEVGNNKGGNV